tara:strand:+ start:5407 stop:5787 length:381 start_codon:yes stop_codon:yes gene_type:complete
MDTMEQQADELVEKVLASQPATFCEYKHERVAVLEDGRVQVKITCQSEWLEKPLSVITNNDQIGITPFQNGHVSKLNAHDDEGKLVELFGFFAEEGLRDSDENVYIDGICKTLISGATNDLFGAYE